MRIELRVCRHCFDGEHDNEHKQAVTRDLITCVWTVREHQGELDLEDMHIRLVSEGDSDDGRPATLLTVGVTIRNGQVVISDTQLITRGENGYMLVYTSPQDALKLLAGNVDELGRVVGEEIAPELSPEGTEILAGYDGPGSGPGPDENESPPRGSSGSAGSTNGV